jgi:hypothetical protein
MLKYPSGKAVRIPACPLVTVDVPANSYRLAMLGEYAEAFELVFDYSNLSILELQYDDDLNLFGVFEMPKGETLLPLIAEYWGNELGNLAEAVKNNIRLEM